MFYRFARVVLWALFRVLFRYRAEGTELLPQSGGYIVACNHRSGCDPIFLGIALKPTLTFMAKAELFSMPVVGWIVRALGAFPIERGKGDTGAIDFAVRTIEEGRVLAMFPEGTRSKDGVLQRGKTGCAVVAGASGATVVPAAVCFEGGLRPFARVTVRFGAPISPQELGVETASPRTFRNGTRMIMERIALLLGTPPSEEGRGEA